MIDRIRASLARHLPGYEVQSVAGMGEGLDNVAYEVNGELIVRESKEADPAIRSEALTRLRLLGTAKARAYLEKAAKNR